MAGYAIRAVFFTFITVTALIAVTSPAAAYDPELNLNVTVPRQPTAGETVTVYADFSLPEDPIADHTTTVSATLSLDGQIVAQKDIELSDGQSRNVSFSIEFPSSGTHTITVEGSTTLVGVELSTSVSKDLNVSSPTRSGASFPVPSSLQDEVDELRSTLGVDSHLRAFVFATSESLYVVFSSGTPKIAETKVSGTAAETSVNYRNLSIGAIAATSVEFSTSPASTTVDMVQAQPGDFDLEYVEITSTHRRLSTLTDPDTGQDFTAAETVGLLGSFDQSSRIADRPGAFTRNFSFNTATTERPTTGREMLEQVTNAPASSGLFTVQFSPRYAGASQATVNGIVIAPDTPGRDFLDAVDEVELITPSHPVIYIADNRWAATNIASISEAKRQESGATIRFTANVTGLRISTQETLEHFSSCTQDQALVPIGSGAVCLNLVQDVAIDVGAAWTSSPETADDLGVVVGLSGSESDTPVTTVSGRYQLVTEVRSTSTVAPSLPNQTVLLVINATRVGDLQGDIDSGLVDTAAGSVQDAVDEQVNRTPTNESGPPALPGFDTAPTDPDSDGKYEDVNGDGEFSIVDVQVLFVNRNAKAVMNNPTSFDFSGDGEFSIVDIQVLFANNV